MINGYNDFDYVFLYGSGLSALLNLFHEHLCGLESGDAVLGDDDSGILGNVAGSFLRTNLDDEATETAEVNILWRVR